MNAAHSNATPADAGEARVPEPSMEEILASIRRIIADDQSFPGVPRETPALRASLEPTAPVHVLHPEPELPPTAPPASEPHLPEPPQVVQHVVQPPHAAWSEPVIPPEPTIRAPQFPLPPDPVAEPKPAPVAAAPEPPPPADEERRFEPAREAPPAAEAEPHVYDAPLGLDRSYARAPQEPQTESLFSAETDHSLTSAFNMLAASRLADNSDQLLAITREMIRPMLREWLDDNLPSMVERLVRAEIERVSRGGR